MVVNRVEDQVQSLIRLRLVVAALGGAAHAKWWRTEYLTDAGLRFLDRLFPRTSHAAALRATTVAARALHDSTIGRGGVFHLFRLPQSLEGELDSVDLTDLLTHVIDELAPHLMDREALIEQLQVLSADEGQSEPGPRRIGTVLELRRGNVQGRWAHAYLHAFRGDFRVFPYVEVEGSC